MKTNNLLNKLGEQAKQTLKLFNEVESNALNEIENIQDENKKKQLKTLLSDAKKKGANHEDLLNKLKDIVK